jgi:hypothetical protein
VFLGRVRQGVKIADAKGGSGKGTFKRISSLTCFAANLPLILRLPDVARSIQEPPMVRHNRAQPYFTFPNWICKPIFNELPSNHLLILCVFCSCKEVLCPSSYRHSKRKLFQSNGNRTSSRTWNKNGRSWLRTPSSCPTGRSSRDWTQRTRTNSCERPFA